jgi:holo-[acyl-carrier protein] synthase
MIKGIGTDIVEVKRISKILLKHGESFLVRVFTKNELKMGKSRKNSAAFFAGRWAAKEAFSKALGTGIGEKCYWTDIEISNDTQGNPVCRISGNAKKTAKQMEISKIHVSISHEREYACSTVILEF